MIWFIPLLNIIAGFALNEGLHKTMVPLLQEAKRLVYTHTDMKIIDTNVFEDQIHILVDDIKHKFADEFDLKMGQLAYGAHISMVSANNSEFTWPLEQISILEFSEQAQPVLVTDPVLVSEAVDIERARQAKRDFRGQSSVYGHGEINCQGESKFVDIIIAGMCFLQRHEAIGSSRVDNYSGYSMHVAVYIDKYCTRNVRKGYHWQRPFTAACYNAKTDNSVWWDWPGYNAP